MVEYKCMRCGYIASQRCNFKNHLNRKISCLPILEDISIETIKIKYGFIKLDNDPQNSSLIPQNSSFSPPQNSSLFPHKSSLFPQNSSLFPHKSSLFDHSTNKNLVCKFCSRNCSRSDNLKRHLKTCKKKKEYEILMEEKNKEAELFKTELSNNRNNTITNINNTTNNTTNNTIIINNYGEENIEHINKKYLLNLLSKTHRAIPLLVEKIHFDPKHPENQNIKLPNKKLPYIKIRKNDKWQFVDRKSEIVNLIDAMCFILSENYQSIELKGKKNLNQNQINVIEKYLDKYRNDDKELMKELENIVDLTLINNSL